MKILVDTNVLVRSVQRSSPLMRPARDALRRLHRQGEELCVAIQNVAEFWNACTRPVENNGLGHSVAATDRLVSRIGTFFTVLPDPVMTFHHLKHLLLTHEVKGVKVHDARLVATMVTHGITHILTFNGADFARYEGITAMSPLESKPGSPDQPA